MTTNQVIDDIAKYKLAQDMDTKINILLGNFEFADDNDSKFSDEEIFGKIF